MSEAPSDAELLERWAAGDADAGNLLAGRYFRSIYAFFRRRVPGDAEDLTQHTFLAALESRTRLRTSASFRAFLFGIARNKLLMHLRRQRIAAAHDNKPDAPSSELSLSGLVAQKREQRLLVEALRGLPHELQLVCELFYWEGLKAREIGEILEVPTSTITTRLTRARALIRERVAELGADTPRLVTTTIDNLEAWARSLARSGQGVEPALEGREGEAPA